jgi:hypothetical protein
MLEINIQNRARAGNRLSGGPANPLQLNIGNLAHKWY